MPEHSLVSKASVPLTLDGTEYRLSYRAYAFVRYSEEFGRDLLADLQAAQGIAEKLRTGAFDSAALFRSVADFLWAGLLDSMPDITHDQVLRMFGLSDLQMILEAIMAGISASMPEAAPKANPPKGRVRSSRLTDGSASLPSLETDAELPPASSPV